MSKLRILKRTLLRLETQIYKLDNGKSLAQDSFHITFQNRRNMTWNTQIQCKEGAKYGIFIMFGIITFWKPWKGSCFNVHYYITKVNGVANSTCQTRDCAQLGFQFKGCAVNETRRIIEYQSKWHTVGLKPWVGLCATLCKVSMLDFELFFCRKSQWSRWWFQYGTYKSRGWNVQWRQGSKNWSKE